MSQPSQVSQPFQPLGPNPQVGNALYLGFKPSPAKGAPFPRRMTFFALRPAKDTAGTAQKVGDRQQELVAPVSLIWDEDVALETEAALVQFPLNPHESGKWYQWKASAAAPLVVYDPQHRGAITSGAQLFGHWTFGGKQTALLDSLW